MNQTVLMLSIFLTCTSPIFAVEMAKFVLMAANTSLDPRMIYLNQSFASSMSNTTTIIRCSSICGGMSQCKGFQMHYYIHSRWTGPGAAGHQHCQLFNHSVDFPGRLYKSRGVHIYVRSTALTAKPHWPVTSSTKGEDDEYDYESEKSSEEDDDQDNNI